jgi:neprilysin
MNWLEYFNRILPAESQLTATDTVVVGALSFFERLGDLINRTPKRVVANYIAWRQASASVGYLPEVFRQRQFQYTKATSGLADPDPRWLECINVALNYYPHAFGSLYVRKHFNTKAKAIAQEMVDNIRDEFKVMLKEITWMDDETKKGAEQKADTISSQIGFADELIDDAKLTEYYDSFGVTIDPAKYFDSAILMNVASSTRNNRRLREAVDKNDWTSFVTPAIVNAFYSSLENSIKFPAGILQGAFFNAERPQYMNYGGIGFVIGHEITHGEFNSRFSHGIF